MNIKKITTYFILGIAVCLTIFIVYKYFLSSPDITADTKSAAPKTTTETKVDIKAIKGLVNKKLDIDIFSNPKFISLKESIGVQTTKVKVGNRNIFNIE